MGVIPVGNPNDQRADASRVAELLSALRDSGTQDPEAIFEAARPLLQIPERLSGCITIGANVAALRPYLQALIDPRDYLAIDQWCEALLAIPADSPFRANPHLSGAIRAQGRVTPPTHRLKTSHPVWCALWHGYWSPSDPEACTYRMLQSHYLAAHVLMLGQAIRVDRRYQASRFIRTVHQREYGWLMADLWGCEDRNDLVHALAAIKDQAQVKGTSASFCHQAGALAQVISDGHGLERTVFGENNGGGGGARIRHSRTLDQMYPDHSGYWYFSDSDLLVSGWGSRATRGYADVPALDVRDELANSGLDPMEYQSGSMAEISIDDLVHGPEDEADENRSKNESDDGEGIESLPPLASLYARARARANRMGMDTQRLRIEPNRIRVTQLRRIIETLNSIFRETAPAVVARRTVRTQQEYQKVRETVLLGAISLVTGVSPSDARHIRLVSSVRDLPAYYRLAFNADYGVWIRPYQEPDRHPIQSEYLAHARETWPRVVYVDVLGVGAWLAQWKRDADEKRKRPFSVRMDVYKKCWRRWVAPRLREAGVDAYWTRYDALSGILPSWMAWQEEGDHLASSVLFATMDPLALVHRYYTTWQRADLAERYHHQIRTLWEKLALPQPDDASSALLQYRNPNTLINKSWVGNDRAPTPVSVSTLVQKLRNRLGKNGAEHRVQIHNTLTAYTALGLAMATGMRAVRTPVPDLRAIHHTTGTMAIQEKDRNDGAHARLVALPGVVIEQVKIYLDHLIHLYACMPDLPWVITVRSNKFRDRSSYDDGAYSLDLRRTFFFLDNQYRPEELTGRILAAHFHDVCPGHWPVDNAARHYLRTYLTSKQCPATVINTHLGHAHYGEEPWGAPSAMDPLGYRETVVPYLEQLLDDIGYRVHAP